MELYTCIKLLSSSVNESRQVSQISENADAADGESFGMLRHGTM